jgi:hypothetical protein
VTNPRGNVRRVTFNFSGAGHLTSGGVNTYA